MEILSILTGAFVAGCDLGIKKYTEENVRDGEEHRIWKGKGIYRKVHNKGLMMNHLDSRPKLVKGMSAAKTWNPVFLGAPSLERTRTQTGKAWNIADAGRSSW